MVDAKVAECVIVDRHAPQNPQVDDVGLATAVQFAGAADSIERRLQPQGHEDLRGNGAAAGEAVRDTDLFIEGLQVERLHERPDDPHAVVRRQQLVEREELHLDLTTVRAFDTGGGGIVFCILTVSVVRTS